MFADRSPTKAKKQSKPPPPLDKPGQASAVAPAAEAAAAAAAVVPSDSEGDDVRDTEDNAEQPRSASRGDAPSAIAVTDYASSRLPRAAVDTMSLTATIRNKLAKMSRVRPQVTAGLRCGQVLPALASTPGPKAPGGCPGRGRERRATPSRYQTDARKQSAPAPQRQQPGEARRTADKAVQTASPSAEAAAVLDDEASTSVETAQRSLSRSAEAPCRRSRSAFRVLPWLARVNSASLAASKEELDKLYKENADLMRRLAHAKPTAFKSDEHAVPPPPPPREYEMYVSNTSMKKTRSISIQIDMPKFKSQKKNRMTTEATILMLIRKLRRVLKANRTQTFSRS